MIQGFYDIQTVPLTFINEKQTIRLIENKEKFKALFLKKYNSDEVFNESIRQFTSNPANVIYRMEMMHSLILSAIK